MIFFVVYHALITSDKHILRNCQVGAERDLLINRTDAVILCILWRTNINFYSIHGNLTAVTWIYACKDLD